MKIEPRLTGIFTPKEATLKKLIDLKYERVTARPFEEIFFDDTKELIEIQENLGFKFISDGQQLWGDLFRPIYLDKITLKKRIDSEGSVDSNDRITMRGIGIGSMDRWYETNGFCFPSRIVGKPQSDNHQINDYLFKENGQIKATQLTLPGLYSLVRRSQNVAKTQTLELLEVFTNQLQKIITSLPPPIILVEFSEPSIAYDEKIKTITETEQKNLLQKTKEAYRRLLTNTNITSLLQLPQGNFLKFPELLEFPVNGFGIDLTETTKFLSEINLQGKILSAGIVDAWSSVPEDIDYLARRVHQAIEVWQPKEVYITSNSQLYQTIDYNGAKQKLTDIAGLARRLS